MSALLPLLIAVPLVGAALSLLFISSRVMQRVISLACSTATAAMAVALVIGVDRDGTEVAAIGGWPAEIAINLVADRFAALLLTISTTMLLAVLVYAMGQRGDDERSRFYHPAYLALIGGVCGAFLAGDLFNLFVWFEVLLIASYVLLTLEGDDEQIRSGTTYVVLNVIESFVLVTGVALIFAATGTLNMAALPERLAELPDGIRLGLNLLLLIAFGLKAAVFPLYSWLPDSYPAAPSPVSAVFAGLLTKIGVYALIRTQTLLFPDTNRTLLLVIAGLTMVVGVVGAIAQSDMKRILSFHIVSQIGYMVMGLALGGVAAISATIFYMLHHIPVKTSLFLVEGIVTSDSGSSNLSSVSGLARRSGPLAALFLIPAFSLAGLPPFSGFLGKTAVVTEGLDQGSWWIVGVALAVSLMTLISMLKIWTGAFWGAPASDPGSGEVDAADSAVGDGTGILRHHPLMGGVTATVVTGTLVIAVFAGPLYRFCERAAIDVTDITSYVTAVLP
ncbi:MAG: proton-conducting transporter membrane subunit [Actinomycetota bacterium]